MKEGTEGVMELSDVDELTMKAFLQWVYYKGEYTIENPKASSSLLKHTKVYVLADRFNIVPLKDLSYNQITTLLADLGMVAAADDVEAVMAAVSFAFGNLPFSSSTLSSITAPTERLLKYFAHYTSWALDVFRTNAELCSLLEHSPDFAKALVTNSRSAPTAPWAASTIDSGSESKGTMTLTASYTGDKSHILHRGCARPECSYTGVMIIQCPSCKKVDSEIGGSIQFKGSILGTVEQDRITGTKTSYSYKCKWCNVKSDMGGTRGEKLFCRKCLYGSQDWVMT
ncbi:hypothetical protein BDZ91DRAFT_745558 [Kalaharituber pfeilii]|nr:hypothetical protein BDZ91DRAFT_745558 [Kalaharituber pfeilii]